VYLPPLRNRMEDVPLLINTFMSRLRQGTGKAITGLTHSAMDRVMAYHWPGNVRELKSALDYAFVLAEKGLIEPDHLPPLVEKNDGLDAAPDGPDVRNPGEKESLIRALRQTNGNQSQAARILGINRVTVWNRMKKYGIDLKKVMVAQ